MNELAGIAAASPRYVAFLYASPGGMFHTGMKVMISFNGGRTMWQTRQDLRRGETWPRSRWRPAVTA